MLDDGHNDGISYMKSKYKNLLRVEKKAVFNWVKILAMVCFWRFLMFKFVASDAMIQQARSMAHFIPLACYTWSFLGRCLSFDALSVGQSNVSEIKDVFLAV